MQPKIKMQGMDPIVYVGRSHFNRLTMVAACFGRLLYGFCLVSCIVCWVGCQTFRNQRAPVAQQLDELDLPTTDVSFDNATRIQSNQKTPTGPPNSETAEPSTAKIRGQSPPGNALNGSAANAWSANTLDGSQTNRGQMPPTDATKTAGVSSNTLLAQQIIQNPYGGYSNGAASTPSATYGQPIYDQLGGQSPYAGTIQPGQVAGQPGQIVGQPGGYGYTAPGVGMYQPSASDSILAPSTMGNDPLGLVGPGPSQYRPRERISPIDVYVEEDRTGRVMFGGSVNSDLGVAGQIIIDERNFDIRRFPTSWNDLIDGRAFRGRGQNFRMELMPGNRVDRYTANWSTRNLFGYSPYSLSVGGFLFTRQFRDWTEKRIGGRMAIGYEVTKDLALSTELRLEDVKISNPRLPGITELDSALGSNDIYTFRVRLAHDTRDSPFMATEGHYFEMIFDQVFGEYDYSRGNVNYSRYFLIKERPDGGGRHTLATSIKFGVTGSQTPIFDNFFAGGYSTLRGFSFRGASPKVGDVQVGGEMMMLGSIEYLFPLTADEMLRGVAFVDYGTVEQQVELNSENFRVAPGLGLRVSVPALGPAPLAFDFAVPINYASTDDRQVFSFFMGLTR
ncbi:MAG: BamA/TamA family outer membrane protein [Planctomycetales bacterium]|nr:BamA/TamA family outer membrane protein [Planctomycetales bacterium]